MIHIVDANNYVRRLQEYSTDGQLPRSLFLKNLNPEVLTFYVWDDPLNGLKMRRNIFSGYKAKRQPLKEDVTVVFDLVKNVLKHSGVVQVQVPGYEADDVVARLAVHYVDQGEKVHIFSNDRDFLQICGRYPDQVTCEAPVKSGVLLSDIRYHKTLVGDPADSIPGMKGFGEAKWDPQNIPAIKSWLDSVVNGYEPEPFIWGGKACENWASEPENQAELVKYWTIIGFLPVTLDDILLNMQVGDKNYAAGDAYLREFLQ